MVPRRIAFPVRAAGPPTRPSEGTGCSRAAEPCSSRSSCILCDINRPGAREGGPTGWRRGYELMALPAVLWASAAVLGAIVALLAATHLFDDLDPIVPRMPSTFQACSDGVDNAPRLAARSPPGARQLVQDS